MNAFSSLADLAALAAALGIPWSVWIRIRARIIRLRVALARRRLLG